MKLLIDANISWRIIKKIVHFFPESTHVDKAGLSFPAKDIEIWNMALATQYIIVTNDEDFLNLSLSLGFPPKIILLRMGNQSTLAIAEAIIKHKNAIENFHNSNEHGVLELY
jgi:predicted nuclease of predicted toxin-antitoxin system